MKLLDPTDSMLLTQSLEVTEFTEALTEKAKALHSLMLESKGIGLAAVQAGLPLRLVAISDTILPGRFMVNPKIIQASTGTRSMAEGCLSVPGESYQVTRPDWVDVGYRSIAGAHRRRTFRDYEASVVQHEMDHLDGLLISRFTEHLIRS